MSQATNLMGSNELLPLLQQSRAWNADHGITGLLVYIQGIFETHVEGRFIQVLEGEKSEIESLFHDKIAIDARHHHVSLLKEQKIEGRDFSTWQMAFESINLERDKELKDFFELDKEVLKSDAFHESKALINFMKAFPAM